MDDDTIKQYAQRSAIELDRAGGYYCRHVSAMTAEKLHAKSDIAAELAWRDWRIAELEREVTEQARLLGVSGSAEARLLAKVAELEQQLHIEYKRGWKVGQEVAERDQLLCLARIRAVIGDADGRLMQDEVVQRVEALQRDAARYRWLRGDSCPDHSARWTQWEVRRWRAPFWTGDLRRDELDAAVDAAMRKEGGE